MEQKRGEKKQRFLKRKGDKLVQGLGDLKKEETGTPLRTMAITRCPLYSMSAIDGFDCIIKVIISTASAMTDEIK